MLFCFPLFRLASEISVSQKRPTATLYRGKRKLVYETRHFRQLVTPPCKSVTPPSHTTAHHTSTSGNPRTWHSTPHFPTIRSEAEGMLGCVTPVDQTTGPFSDVGGSAT